MTGMSVRYVKCSEMCIKDNFYNLGQKMLKFALGTSRSSLVGRLAIFSSVATLKKCPFLPSSPVIYANWSQMKSFRIAEYTRGLVVQWYRIHFYSRCFFGICWHLKENNLNPKKTTTSAFPPMI